MIPFVDDVVLSIIYITTILQLLSILRRLGSTVPSFVILELGYAKLIFLQLVILAIIRFLRDRKGNVDRLLNANECLFVAIGLFLYTNYKYLLLPHALLLSRRELT